ncbi:TIM barrel protein [Fulvivirgaceae bacterium BMA12]|uniref:TIM barrel protein n=1 Tax=Agaribacillus aureus TaxID=3051825 RepID=A0ABT8L2G3_9BACT|nr:TIM barrel protein [Fulvivirgaceae bacterium BMA12]
MKNYKTPSIFLISILFLIVSCTNQSEQPMDMNNIYPWCIVAYDSLERSPTERIEMMKTMGFVKYAYDWRDRHLDEMARELQLARDNDIEVLSVWLWLNAKGDSLGHLSPSNERIFDILETSQLKTTIWLSFSNNFFEGLTQQQSLDLSTKMIQFVFEKAESIGCKIALYNHRGWFGNPANQVAIIKALPHCHLTMVYNFHHAHQDLNTFPEVVKMIRPYLSAVNINGMRKDEVEILPVGAGDYEKDMIKLLMEAGYDGPWGLLGHVENEDVKIVLERNMAGFRALLAKQPLPD